MKDDTITKHENVTIDNVDTLSHIVEEAEPDTNYEVVLSAYTRAGHSTEEKRELKTGKPGGWSIIGSFKVLGFMLI